MIILRLIPVTFLLLFLSVSISAQNSRGFSYQAVARDAAGNIQPNATINIEFDILNDVQAQIYEENHIGIQTNDYGLFALTIGEGMSSQNFGAINWASGKHYLVVVLNGLPMDTTELAAVPYAKVATDMRVTDLTDVSISTLNNGDVLKWDGNSWVSGQDEVNDADADPTNEIQSLSLLGNNLSISNGNTVSLPSTTYTAGTGISIANFVISNTGDLDPTDDLTVNSIAGGDISGVFSNLSVNALKGNPISNTAPLNGQILKFNGLNWVPSTDNIGTPIWTQSGNNIYYNTGRVAIGTNSPSTTLDVEQNTGSGTVAKFEHLGAFVSNQNLLELKVPGTAAADGQMIEFYQGNNINAQINVDGAATFKTIKANDNLSPSTTAPETGTLYANSLPIAYGYVSSSGQVLQGYGISSVTRSATGEFDITLSKTPVGYPVIIATSFGTTPDNEIITTAGSLNSPIINVNIEESGSGSNSFFYFVVYGNTQ